MAVGKKKKKKGLKCQPAQAEAADIKYQLAVVTLLPVASRFNSTAAINANSPPPAFLYTTAVLTRKIYIPCQSATPL